MLREKDICMTKEEYEMFTQKVQPTDAVLKSLQKKGYVDLAFGMTHLGLIAAREYENTLDKQA